MSEPVPTLSPDEAALLHKIVGDASGGMHLTAGVHVVEPRAPENTPIMTLPPEVSFLTTKIPPPAPFYLAREDQLLVSIYNSVAGAAVFLGARFLRPDGVIVPVVRTFNPTSDRILNSFTVPPTEGFLLGLHVGTATVSQPGQCYISVLVNRPQAAPGTELHTLVEGYVTNTIRPSWPVSPPRDPREGPGALRNVTGTTPAPGSEITQTVPTNTRWKLRAMRFFLTTSIAGANRVVRLFFDDGVNVFYASESRLVETQNLSFGYSYGAFLGFEETAVSIDQIAIGLPDFLMPGGFRFRTNTVAIQGGDQYTAPQFLVEEWIDT